VKIEPPGFGVQVSKVERFCEEPRGMSLKLGSQGIQEEDGEK
jgi:hypothetical protein